MDNIFSFSNNQERNYIFFMEIRQLEYFRAIVDAGTISGAARVLHMTQPPLSYQMKMLEEELQVPIFLQKTKKYVYVEVQLRTIAMDFWASLEHKLRYKKNIPEDEAKLIAQELYDCSVESAKLDERMQKIRSMMNKGESK